MTFSDIIETASAWHGGQSSALYSFVSTKKIHSREHKITLLREVVQEIGGEGLNEGTLETEKQELDYLCQFVQTAPINEDLSSCTVADDGKFLFLYKETPETIEVPHGWDTVTA